MMSENNNIRDYTVGDYILQEFVQPLGLSEKQIARDTGIKYSVVQAILSGKEPITPEISRILGDYFFLSPNVLLLIQKDLEEKEKRIYAKKMD